MKKNRLILVLAIILAVGVAITGTVAYFSVNTTFENVFKATFTPTMKQLEVVLTEPLWDGLGMDDEPVIVPLPLGKDMAKKVLPGMVIPKNPTITIIKESVPVYARYAVVVTDSKGNIVTDQTIIDGILATTDVAETKDMNRAEIDIAAGVVYFNVQKIFDPKATVENGHIETHTLFTKLTIPGQWKQEEVDRYGNFHIKIIAQAISIEGYDSADKALAELGNPYLPTNP